MSVDYAGSVFEVAHEGRRLCLFVGYAPMESVQLLEKRDDRMYTTDRLRAVVCEGAKLALGGELVVDERGHGARHRGRNPRAADLEQHEGPEHPTKVVDTTGAGDLYAAGFLFGIATGRGLEVAGRLGSLAAAEIISGSGKKYDPALVEAFKKALSVMTKVRETYSDALGDMINLDFSPARRSTTAAERARAKSNR